ERGAEGAGRRHLLEAGELTELTLERRGHRRGHDVGARPRKEGQDLDGRVVDLGKGGDGELRVGYGPREEHGHRKKRGGDGLEDEDPSRIHGLTAPSPKGSRPPS